MTIELGWWLLPLFITIAAFSYANKTMPPTQPGGYIPDVIGPMIGGVHMLIAAVVSLFSWLIWALVS